MKLNFRFKKIIKSKSLLFSFIFIILFTRNAFSHGGLEHYSWTTLSSSGLYDLKNDKLFSNYDLNFSLMIVNLGFSYKNITYAKADNFTIYCGIGAGSFFQFQVGLTREGHSIRNRFDIPMGYISSDLLKENSFLSYITISPVFEKYFNNSKMDWYYGIGIGISINNVQGFDYFKFQHPTLF